MLQKLLDKGAGDDAEYGGSLSNHLPMALVALKRLGASDIRLAAFARNYRRAKKLPAAPPAAAWPGGEAWASRFGKRSAWPAYRALFAQWLVIEGGAAVVTQALPALMPGCGAAAFHGLIRTAYALQVGHAGELADGLAYWACRHLRLGERPHGRQADPAKLLGELVAAFADQPPPRSRLILDRMLEAATAPPAAPTFARITQRLKVGDATLAALARQAARVYAGSGNFTALHLVTSAHALRVILPLADEPLAAVGDYWVPYAAGVLASKVALDKLEPAPAPRPWPELVAAAVSSDDDHLIKIVDSCREEERVYGGDDWQRAATRAVIDS